MTSAPRHPVETAQISLVLPPAIVATDAEANRAQRVFLRLTVAQISVGLASAIAGVVAITSSRLNWLGVAASAGFPIITILRIFQRKGAADTKWYACRAASESMKSLVWRYAVRVDPFALDDSDADARFDEQLRSVVEGAGPSFPVPFADAEINASMRALRAAPLPVRTAAYECDRLFDQLRWYDGRARRFKLIALRADRVFLLLSAVAIGAGVVGLWSELARGVVAMAAAIIGVILGWVGTRGYGGLARSYAATARDLGAVRARVDGVRSDEDWSRLVDEAEQVIGRERTHWRAARS